MREIAPSISVVIPTYNRRDVLLECLTALCAQDLAPDEFEILVADDGSSDGTAEAVTRFAEHAPVSVRYSWAENRGANAARNRAIEESRGRILVIINDDTIAVPDFLHQHLSAHAEYPGDEVAVLGRVTISPKVPYSVFADLHLDAAYAPFWGVRELDWRAFFTCNISVKAAFLHRWGMFEENLRWHEDLELGERLARHGLRVIYEPKALGYHLHHLQEKDYLGVAEREGVSLANWYAKDNSLRDVLGSLGFHRAASWRKRIVYWCADRVLNPRIYPAFLFLARRLSRKHPACAQALYRKLFQAHKRQATDQRLQQIGISHV